jgi:hypothetical protein
MTLLASRTPGANSSSLRLSLCTNHHIDVLAAVCRNDTDLLQAVRQIQINTPKRVVWLSAEDRLLPSGLAAGIPETHFDALDLAAELGASVTSRRAHSAMKGTASVASCMWSTMALLLWGLMMIVLVPLGAAFKRWPKATTGAILFSLFISVGNHLMVTATESALGGWIAGPAANTAACVAFNGDTNVTTANCTTTCFNNSTSDVCDGACCVNWCCLTPDARRQLSQGIGVAVIPSGVTALIISCMLMAEYSSPREENRESIVDVFWLIFGLLFFIAGAVGIIIGGVFAGEKLDCNDWEPGSLSLFELPSIACPAPRYVNGTF